VEGVELGTGGDVWIVESRSSAKQDAEAAYSMPTSSSSQFQKTLMEEVQELILKGFL